MRARYNGSWAHLARHVLKRDKDADQPRARLVGLARVAVKGLSGRAGVGHNVRELPQLSVRAELVLQRRSERLHRLAHRLAHVLCERQPALQPQARAVRVRLEVILREPVNL